MALVASAGAPADNGLNEDGTSRLCQFSKTKLCKFHVLGKCTKGVQCPFAHEGLELRKLPDLRRTKLCKVLIQTGQCSNAACMYAHTKDELRSTGAFHKTKLCRFMQTGHCTLGGKCNFAHSFVELREPETIEALESPPGLGGWESMLGGLLSDEEEADTKPKDKSKDPGVIHTDPAYIHVRPLTLSDSKGFGTASITKEEMPATMKNAAALNSMWNFQSQMPGRVAMTQGPPSPWDANHAYGADAAFHDWAGPWGNSPMPNPYANPLGGGFGSFAGPPLDAAFGGFGGGYSLFGPSVASDQVGDMKMKTKPPKGAPKVRAARPSECTLATPSDSFVLTPEKA